MTDFELLLQDKRVIIVGPADTIMNKKLGSLIDSYDVVVRLNNPISLLKNKEDYGCRTDVIYSNIITDSYDYFKNNEIFYCCFKGRYDKLKNIFVSSSDNVKFRETSSLLDPSILQAKKPTTGLNSICDLLSYDIKELYILGFSHYYTKYSNHYKIINEKNYKNVINYYHNPREEAVYLKKLSEKDKRIHLDDFLESLYKNI